MNHVNAEEVQAAPDVMYGEFLVNSTLATMLFDSGASHSFVSTCFALRNSLRIVLLPTPLLIRTPGAILMSHPILRIKWDVNSYVRPEISHTHKSTNYE